ncbi:O-antigen ligase family protein [Paenarthrobacter sp. NPDC089316]|uniref:O-antigen ligase family protein n=1 Tax=unclassified Paenarthrobacter TaxID=2634190 RepID=UPI003444AFAA
MIEYTISALAFVALLANLRGMMASKMLVKDFAGVLGVIGVVLGGLLYEARLIPVGQPAQFVIFGLLLTASVLALASYFVTQSRQGTDSRPTLQFAPFLPAMVALAMAVVNAVANPDLPLEQSIGRFLAVSILVLAAFLACCGQISISDVGRIYICSFLLILILSSFVRDNWRPCDIFKCGPFDAIYTGPFSSENGLAIYACVAFLFVFRTWKTAPSILTLAPILLTLYATESRTSQLAMVLAVAAWAGHLLWTKFLSRQREGKTLALGNKGSGSAQFYILAVVTVFVIGYYLVLNAEPTQFSNRGMIWIRGMAALGDSWWSGLGLDRWSYLQAIGLLPLLFPHSEYLLVLFGGGLIGVLLLFAVHATSLAAASKTGAELGFAISYNMFLSVLGLTEAYWNPIAFDGHTLLVLPFIYLTARSVSTKRSRSISDNAVKAALQ